MTESSESFGAERPATLLHTLRRLTSDLRAAEAIAEWHPRFAVLAARTIAESALWLFLHAAVRTSLRRDAGREAPSFQTLVQEARRDSGFAAPVQIQFEHVQRHGNRAAHNDDPDEQMAEAWLSVFPALSGILRWLDRTCVRSDEIARPDEPAKSPVGAAVLPLDQLREWCDPEDLEEVQHLFDGRDFGGAMSWLARLEAARSRRLSELDGARLRRATRKVSDALLRAARG